MAVNISGIPVVDFSAMSLTNKEPLRENDESIKKLADQIHQAFSTIGFVYLKNHGIPQELVSTIRSAQIRMGLGKLDLFLPGDEYHLFTFNR